MSLSLTQRAAARSAARMKKPVSPPPPSFPAGTVKATARGTKYRIVTIKLSEYPAFMEANKLEPKIFFHFKPEEDPKIQDAEARYRSGFVLGVRKQGEKEVREL